MAKARPLPVNGSVGMLLRAVPMHNQGGKQIPINSVVRAKVDFAGPAITVISDRYNYHWQILPAEWPAITKEPKKPRNAFVDIDTFLCGLSCDREGTLRELMTRVTDDWLNDGREELVRCMTAWAMRGLSFRNMDDLISIAEGHVDIQWGTPVNA